MAEHRTTIVQKNHHWESLTSMQATLRELKSAADADRNAILGFLIEMAYLEASDQLRNLYQIEIVKTGLRKSVEKDSARERWSA